VARPRFRIDPARLSRLGCGVMKVTDAEAAASLKAMQDDIYREKILRAREMTPEQRLADVFELSNHQLGMMHGGAMHRLGTTNPRKGWEELDRWMERLDRVREHRFYTTERRRA